MARKWLLTGLVMLAVTGRVWGQDVLERDPGYVDLESIEAWFDTQPKIEVNIKGALLELVAEASRYDDPELADLLDKLKAIQVRGYDLGRIRYDEIEQRTGELSRQLEERGWDTVVRVREEVERVDMFVRVHEDNIAGMVVMVVSRDEDESFFVNIVGDISPDQIGRLGRKFDIEPLNDSVVRDYR